MRYAVPVTYEMSGSITVEASSPEEAIEKAREKYSQQGRDTIELPSVDVDFAFGEDPQEVNLVEK